MLMQPEHILFFQLMGLEYMITNRKDHGRLLLDVQRFFDNKSRDIVDESDENFSVKFELFYTIGTQRPVDLSPERWNIIHRVLGMAAKISESLVDVLDLSALEVDTRFSDRRFPKIGILKSEDRYTLLRQIVDAICDKGFPDFALAHQSQATKEAVLVYIFKTDLNDEEISNVESGPFWTESTKGPLLLLQGLIAGGVLGFALGSKRWRVNYGLDENRDPKTQLAVPYRAKDNPSLRAEFSHPDVVIIFTTLSFYYGGLSDSELFLAMEHLVRSIQPEQEYQQWVQTAPNLGSSFRHIVGVNLQDRVQYTDEIFPALRFSKGAIDNFLSHIVFPKEIKEFPYKLSASGWDTGKSKVHPTTGFSGTNDFRHILPLSFEQLDLPEQEHTNALVLEYLLQPENSVEPMPITKNSTDSDAQILLSLVVKLNPEVRVILDGGAQILEMTNEEVAREWLNLTADRQDVQAVVFFNERDEIVVIDRRGWVELLQISPFDSNLDVYLVFLDEAHTRGTDLRLPRCYRAAVTLGANLTKDRLVQACMRMRKTGHGQSVVFCVPAEVQGKIQSLNQILGEEVDKISVLDVLDWAISETHNDLRKCMPLWAMQGARFENQKGPWTKVFGTDEQNAMQLAARDFLKEEAQNLEHRYRPGKKEDDGDLMIVAKSLGGNSENHQGIIDRCREFGAGQFAVATLQEEQERELAPEIEEEKEIQRPPPADAREHELHVDLVMFVQNGQISPSSAALVPAFSSLSDTFAGKRYAKRRFPENQSATIQLLVTRDFSRTIRIPSGDTEYVSDDYQRQVQFVLTHRANGGPVDRMIVISPFEAQGLLPHIRKCAAVTLHLYASRVNQGFAILDRLDLYTVGKPFPKEKANAILPRQMVAQLNLFAGELFFETYAEYKEVCQLLGLSYSAGKEEGLVTAPIGFILARGGEEIGRPEHSPVLYLKTMLSRVRGGCLGIDKTHLGRILGGEVLTEEDFEKK